MTDFFFSIPLKSMRVSDDWRRVEAVFNRTLKSIFNQTDQDFAVLVAYHEIPDHAFKDRDNIFFLPVAYPVFKDHELMFADRNLKERVLAAEIRRRGGGYMFTVDYDDLVSNRIVEHVHTDRNPHGYILHHGYECEFNRGVVRRLPGVPAIGPLFYEVCGTCAIIRFTPEDLPIDMDDTAPRVFDQFCSNHQLWEKRARALGRPLAPLPFPGVLYIVDTGMSLAQFSGMRGPRMRLNEILARERPISPKEMVEFGIPAQRMPIGAAKAYPVLSG